MASRAGDIVDAALDPLDSSIIYLCVRGVGVLKSVTAGFGPWTTVREWSSANNPTTTEMKIALGYRNADGSMQTDANRTVVAKLSIEFFVSRNGGRSSGGGWISKGAGGTTYQLGWNNVLAVDPFDPAVFLTGDFGLYRTTNSGDNWTGIPVPHEDQQSLIFDRDTRGVAYLANDGGVFRSTDGGQTWLIQPTVTADEIAAGRSLVKNLATAEFYRVGVQNHIAVGNLFHSGLIGSTSVASGQWEGIEGHAWEWAYAFADPKRIGRFYIFHGQLGRRRYPGTGTDDFILNFATFQPYISDASTSRPVGAIAVDARPGSGIILVSAYPDSTAGTGYRLMMTTEGDREPFTAPDGSVTNQPTWTMVINNAQPIAAVIFAPSAPVRAYAMANNGRLFRKDDIDTPGAWTQLGQWSLSDVRQMAVNSSNADRLYAVARNRVGRSINGGADWVDIGGSSLPASEFNSLIAHPTIANRLYLGADIGVFVSDDEGDTWQPYDDDLPNAEVQQFFLTGNYLYAVTHGRGLWRRRLC
jgi:photosystem II stability/assembly factor-like uncharacterized protein